MAALGVAVLSCMDAAMKVVSAAYPIGEVVGLRYASGALVALIAFCAWRGARPTLGALKRNLVRAVVMICTAVTFFTAIARLPLADAIALDLHGAAPHGAARPPDPQGAGRAQSARRHRHRLRRRHRHRARPASRPVGRSFDPVGIAAALACAFFYALSMVLMRQQSAKDDAVTIVALSNMLALSCSSRRSWPCNGRLRARAISSLFALAGLLGTCGHLCLAWAYSRAHAGRLGILEYTAFLWGTLFGYLFFAEMPTAATFGGAGLIIVACLMAAFTRPKRGPAPCRPATPEAACRPPRVRREP